MTQLQDIGEPLRLNWIEAAGLLVLVVVVYFMARLLLGPAPK